MDRLTQEKFNKDSELVNKDEIIEKLKVQVRELEQGLIEKADLANSLQKLSDERKEANEALEKEIQELRGKHEQQLAILPTQQDQSKVTDLENELKQLKIANEAVLEERGAEITSLKAKLILAE